MQLLDTHLPVDRLWQCWSEGEAGLKERGPVQSQGESVQNEWIPVQIPERPVSSYEGLV
jgi:hypothetical protein